MLMHVNACSFFLSFFLSFSLSLLMCTVGNVDNRQCVFHLNLAQELDMANCQRFTLSRWEALESGVQGRNAALAMASMAGWGKEMIQG